MELPGAKTSEISPRYRGHQPQVGVFGGQPLVGTVTLVPPPRVNPIPRPTPTAPVTIPIVPQTPRCGPTPGRLDGAPVSVSLPEATSRSSVACCGGSGPELSPLRPPGICPALTSTQTPPKLQTFNSP